MRWNQVKFNANFDIISFIINHLGIEYIFLFSLRPTIRYVISTPIISIPKYFQPSSIQQNVFSSNGSFFAGFSTCLWLLCHQHNLNRCWHFHVRFRLTACCWQLKSKERASRLQETIKLCTFFLFVYLNQFEAKVWAKAQESGQRLEKLWNNEQLKQREY